MYIQCLFLKANWSRFVYLAAVPGCVRKYFQSLYSVLLFPLFLCRHLFSFFAWLLTLCHLSHIVYYKPGRNLLCPPVVHKQVKLASFFHTYES